MNTLELDNLNKSVLIHKLKAAWPRGLLHKKADLMAKDQPITKQKVFQIQAEFERRFADHKKSEDAKAKAGKAEHQAVDAALVRLNNAIFNNNQKKIELLPRDEQFKVIQQIQAINHIPGAGRFLDQGRLNSLTEDRWDRKSDCGDASDSDSDLDLLLQINESEFRTPQGHSSNQGVAISSNSDASNRDKSMTPSSGRWI